MLKVTIQIKEQLDTCWSDWFNDLEILHTETGNTVLQGNVQDSAAFYGILAKLHDLGLKLLLIDAKEMGDIKG